MCRDAFTTSQKIFFDDTLPEQRKISYSSLPVKVSPERPSIRVDYYWIIRQLDKRLGKCPDDVKDALIDMGLEENERMK